MNDIRLKPPAQPHQGRNTASERQGTALLALAYLCALHAMRVEKRIVMAPAAGVDNLMSLSHLSARQVDSNVDIPIAMPAMLDQMKNMHRLSGTLARGFV
jgi:hypothetical protein